MKGWRESLSFDPIPAIASSGNKAVVYFAMRDLLGQKVEPIECVWQLRDVQRICGKQQSGGSWQYAGKKTVAYPKHHYALLETFKQFRLLVERYEFARGNGVTRKAAEFLFSCQTPEGDFRGMLANQYATYYTGAIMALLIRAGYENDPRIEKGFKWLLSMRQNDGGWTIPILTHKFDKQTMCRLTSQYAKPVKPDLSKPFSYNWTDMVLRAFAAHPEHRKSEAARVAANLLKSRFFKADSYSSHKAATYWTRFLFWWPNLITALDSLSLMGFTRDDPDIQEALHWIVKHQRSDGLWKTTYVKENKVAENAKNNELKLWVTLAICRILKRLYG